MKMTMNLGTRSYDIILKRGCLSNLHQFTDLTHRRVFVLTDSGVPAQYARTVADQCENGTVYTIPQGEGSKCLKVYGQVLTAMLEFGMDRKDLLVAVGGGVVGDLGGFCAASYMRGIDFVNCPTTTLSQIDSSIGGKTAIDLGSAKNIVGAFWQPQVVLVDPDTLTTLPRRQYINGLAEAVKAGLIADPELFDVFEHGDVDKDIETIIYRSLLVKKKIVEQDERESGARKALNFGHTIGHGIEAVKGVRGRRTNGLYHGECVALGMLPMIEDRSLQKRTRAVLRKLGLPVRTGVDKHKVLEYMRHDKKSGGKSITVIRVPGLGCWRADTLPMTQLPALLGLEEE
ncbi:3-dehydroquinate synthase [uncultured Gemmiger sp.]|uniref:3-dehydroquinate synthase n=1 Tax=uncultured Gemmiger sp. TaxID=1623490 RepID=UPI0025D61678|nr:3-dehydroquinate synthase [uncultured Gemmiger sp.]